MSPTPYDRSVGKLLLFHAVVTSLANVLQRSPWGFCVFAKTIRFGSHFLRLWRTFFYTIRYALSLGWHFHFIVGRRKYNFDSIVIITTALSHINHHRRLHVVQSKSNGWIRVIIYQKLIVAVTAHQKCVYLLSKSNISPVKSRWKRKIRREIIASCAHHFHWVSIRHSVVCTWLRTLQLHRLMTQLKRFLFWRNIERGVCVSMSKLIPNHFNLMNVDYRRLFQCN